MISTWIKETNSSRPWVILVHGIRSCKANHEVLLPAGMLVKADFNVVLMDMRDHWKSTIEDNQVSAGQKEWRDMVGVHDYLVNERGVDAEKIGIFGASMGRHIWNSILSTRYSSSMARYSVLEHGRYHL